MRHHKNPSFVLRSRRVLTRDGLQEAAIVVTEGIITAVADARQLTPSTQDIDVGELVVLPGLVDPHVHINEPGRTAWEGFETATRAAAAGGVTTLVDMPLNSSPVTTSVQALERKLQATKGTLHVDVGFHAGLVPHNAIDMRALLASGVLGVKAFMIDSGIDEFPATSEADFRTAMPAIAESGLPLLVHAELQTSLPTSRTTNPQSYLDYLHSRPRQWENEAVALMIRLCREYRCRVHIVHVSSSEAISLLYDAKAAGLPITAETCPHYLYFSSEEIPDGDTRFKCAPPIREKENNDKLWEALREGVLDFIASDHSPCPPELKLLNEGDFTNAWGGISSLQFGLAILWTEARKRGAQIADVGRWMSTHPANFVGLSHRKGQIAEGFDADFVVWNPEESFLVEQSMIHHRHKLTPYEGRTLFGKVHATYLRGEKIFENGQCPQPSGEILVRMTT